MLCDTNWGKGVLRVAGREVDVVVVGAGGTGSATAWRLAEDGADVLVLEARTADRAPAAPWSASVFQVAGGELAGGDLALRCLPEWRELERDTSSRVLELTGGVAHGSTSALDLLAWTADAVGSPGRWIPAAEAAERWPGIRYGERVFTHPLTGRLDPGAAVRALRRAAVRAGAVLRYGEPVRRIEVRGPDAVEVRTGSRTYRARRAVVAAGPWTGELAGGLLRVPVPRVRREQTMRFPVAREEWPVFLHALDWTTRAVGGYPGDVRGIPSPGGIGTGFLVPGAGEADVVTGSARLRALRRYAQEWLPGTDPDTAMPAEGRYAVTSGFVLDRAGPVVAGTGFSARRFQYLPEIGRLLAELTTTGERRLATP